VFIALGEGFLQILGDVAVVGRISADDAAFYADGLETVHFVNGDVGFKHKDLFMQRGNHFLLLGNHALKVYGNGGSGGR
jgi:hypothetical protein